MQRPQRLMRTPARPESIGEAYEVDLVDGAQDFGDRALDNLVLQGRDTEWSLATVGFGDVHATHRLRLIASAMHSVAQVV
jgi:hypothetical protein